MNPEKQNSPVIRFLNPKGFTLSQALVDIVLIALYLGLVHTLKQRSGSEAHLVWVLSTQIKTAGAVSIFGLMFFNVALPAFFCGWSLYKIESASKWWRNAGAALLALGMGMLGIVGNVSIAVVRNHKTGIDIILALFLGIAVFALCNLLWEGKSDPERKCVDGALKTFIPVVMAVALLFWHYFSMSLGLLLINSYPEYRDFPTFFIIFNLFLSGFFPIRIGYHLIQAKNLLNLALVTGSLYVWFRSTMILIYQLL